MNIFFTADTHFGHENIIKYCDRRFNNGSHMDARLATLWNSVIGPDDLVYHLGDFTLSNQVAALRYFQELNGNIHVAANWWHHDRRWLPDYVGVSDYKSASGHSVWVMEPLEVLEQGSTVQRHLNRDVILVLCHYPFAEWDRKHYGAWHLHAHSHGNHEARGKILDVGVDNAYKVLGQYRPFFIEEVAEYMETAAE
jgi:calcineurin-like phosphoesterase family protein